MYRSYFAFFRKFSVNHFAFRVWKQWSATLLAIVQKKMILQQHGMTYAAFPQGRFDLGYDIAALIFIANQCPYYPVQHLVAILERETYTVFFQPLVIERRDYSTQPVW